MSQKNGNDWIAYAYTKEDKQWKKDGGKTNRLFNITEREMCERTPGNKYTKGKNQNYPGCGKGWCCSAILNTPSLLTSPTKTPPPLIVKPGSDVDCPNHTDEKYYCEYVDSGCKYKCSYDKVFEHEVQCKFKPNVSGVDCPNHTDEEYYCEYVDSGCKYKCSYDKVLEHEVQCKFKPNVSGKCVSGNEGNVVFTFPKGKPLLAEVYKDTFDPTGWWASEKFDGYRAIWNGKEFLSRGGNVIIVPEWFSALMPPSIALDGELWMGRGGFSSCGLFRHKEADTEKWIERQALFKVFDIPSLDLPFEQRMEKLQELIDNRCDCMLSLDLPAGVIDVRCPIEMTQQIEVKSTKQLSQMFDEVVANGGEGIMIREPGSFYENKRSRTLYKLKPEHDTECTIIGYKPGTGKYTGMLGSLQCELLVGKNTPFYVSGMTDKVRKNYKKTHPIGTVITITYTEMQDSGIPRHPRYLRIRSDSAF